MISFPSTHLSKPHLSFLSFFFFKKQNRTKQVNKQKREKVKKKAQETHINIDTYTEMK